MPVQRIVSARETIGLEPRGGRIRMWRGQCEPRRGDDVDRTFAHLRNGHHAAGQGDGGGHGTQLMTIFDMSTVQAVLMVDETDTPNIARAGRYGGELGFDGKAEARVARRGPLPR